MALLFIIIKQTLPSRIHLLGGICTRHSGKGGGVARLKAIDHLCAKVHLSASVTDFFKMGSISNELEGRFAELLGVTHGFLLRQPTKSRPGQGRFYWY